MLSKKEISYLIVFIVLGVFLIFQSQSSSGKSILETIENPTEIVNTIISLIAAAIAIQVIIIFGSGAQASAWKWMAISAIIFAIVEIVGLLKGLEIWKVGGLLDFIEFFFVVALFIGFHKQKKILTGGESA